MSYYPQPFPPPPPQGPFGFDYYRPVPQPLAAARRASVMLWIFGGLLLLCGVCVGVVAGLAPMDQLLQQMRQYSPDQAQQFSTPQMQTALRIAYAFIGLVALVTGLVMVGTAWFVRQGRRGAVITAMVACAPILLWALISMLGGLIALAAGALLGIGQLALGIVVAGIVGLTVSWLWQALGASGLADQQRLMQQQYWQYLQQQQQGYGYATPGATQQQPAASQPWMNLPPPPSSQPSLDELRRNPPDGRT